ncbi:amino acid ABC transporter membrane protein, PAAT family (TC 3.A.1.3.-) [Oceanospirillum multiglobuliferum]|uniref:Putative glutamine transport system permease protein GlnP n=1 Tax=Oceanospirillum multiglobuliferum TaxID=64969 RepID=A0A1T4R5A6_9GAMM|nr:amino acid ABC transporter permease [Oceanospirillum multiglobuliferum]OPX55240.1 ABC transporter permease [Oceanospirillum multiglobuliferum]SKA10841.1 amino acid ABC transporter membrane protein, PAAT family (TC 3.A.1.3.-) [Oceanospirillum multiglobuliferum]
MVKTSNNLLWYSILFAILLGLGYSIILASQSIQYTWRWERIVPYLINTEPKPILSPYDGTVTVSANADAIMVSSDDGESAFEVKVFSQLEVEDGDQVFEGDVIASLSEWRLGPIANGLLMTLKISIVSLFFAVVIGLFVGLARISSNPILKHLSMLYVELVRGTPLLVQIFIFYFFIGTVLELDRFTAGAAALSVFAAAYVAEIIRSGIQSVPVGQMEAARSLGMTYVQAMVYIILPQAFKRTLPPMAGQFITLIKDSSLVSVISITDLTKAGREVVSGTFAPFEVWFTVALLYLLLTGSLSWLVNKLEKRMASSD